MAEDEAHERIQKCDRVIKSYCMKLLTERRKEFPMDEYVACKNKKICMIFDPLPLYKSDSVLVLVTENYVNLRIAQFKTTLSFFSTTTAQYTKRSSYSIRIYRIICSSVRVHCRDLQPGAETQVPDFHLRLHRHEPYSS